MIGKGAVVSLGLEGFDSLSKTSDHLGNIANVLSVLGGPTTILHELTQNADDAKTATRVAFTVSSAELTAWNDGEFSACGDQRLAVCPWKEARGRSCDLHSFRIFAGRHKSEDVDTTGAFGVGFTSVYQITDHPELVTGGYHLVLDESTDEQHRIAVCKEECGRDHGSSGTSFFLPWATEQTDLRMALGAQVVAARDIELLESAFLERAPEALLFLKRVEQIEVQTRSDRAVVKRTRDGDRVSVTDGRSASEWLFLEGEYDSSGDLKARFPQIDKNRSEYVTVALPVGEKVEGRIYGGLPTQTRLGWSGHVNATFYPREDRKGVLFDDGTYRSDWNRDLIDSAAALVRQNLEPASEVIGLDATWELIRDFELASRPGPAHEEAFEPFFERVKDGIADLSIMRTIAGEVRAPRGCLVPQTFDEYKAESVFVDLTLPVVDSTLRATVMSLSFTAFGMELMKAAHVVDALIGHNVVEAWKPPTGIFNDAEMLSLLGVLEILLSRSKTAAIESGAYKPAIVPCIDGKFAAAASTVVINDADQALFIELGEDRIADIARLKEVCPSLVEYCPELDVAIALDILEGADRDQLAATADRVLAWLGNRGFDLQLEEDRSRAAALAIYPSSIGGLKPLHELSLPSDFEDELGLADVVDVSRVRGQGDLLRTLGARDLDAVDYLTQVVVPLADGDTFGDAETLGVILRIIHRARPQLDEDDGAAASVRGARLVLCVDGVVREAADVHLPNAAVELIDPDAPIADVERLPEYLVDALVWLGVGTTPSRSLLNAAARRLADDDSEPDPDVVLSILDAIQGSPERYQSVPLDLRNLQELPWLPVEGGGRERPEKVLPTFRRHLFESQGPKLGLPRETQQVHAETLRWLGMPSDPPTSVIVAHLRHCAETKVPMHPDVYQALGSVSDDRLVQELSGERCIQVTPGEFVEPDFVFWTEAGLGQWVTRLPHDQRRYQEFYDRVGVEEEPGAAQLERLLVRISRAFGNDMLDEEAQVVVHQAWSHLQALLVADEPGVLSPLVRLRRVRSVVDSRGLLNAPDLLVFKDGRGLAERIELLSQNVIRRERATWRALEAAGVRRAEDLIEGIVGDSERAPAPEVAHLLGERRQSILRVIESEFDDGDEQVDPDSLFEIEFSRTNHLSVKYRAEFGNQVQTTEAAEVHAIYVDETKTLLFSEPPDLRRIARELARCLVGEDHPGLALQLETVLSAASSDEAEQNLDELGVADLAEIERTTVGSGTVEDFEYHEPVEPDIPRIRATEECILKESSEVEGGAPEEQEDCEDDDAPDTDASLRPSSLGGGDGSDTTEPNRTDSPTAAGRGTGERSAPRRPSAGGNRIRGERREHMRSYVYYGSDQETETVGDESLRSSSIDAAGVARVLKYESSCGRNPQEQEHSNPGFDVLSHDSAGKVVRRIEVKSVGGDWSLRGVLLSRRQYLEAVEHPDEFWLYVVENAEDDDAFEIHRLKDPVGSISQFGFDDGWKIFREPDIVRNTDGQPAMPTAKSVFLTWGADTQG
ncbi:DUF3883 domain-containing protein [Georgenia sp. M64]|uniref:DUF3883 domain-containing protein n=1 Tax=Georgenia sp. M64 TaxID=3120520 RepID=UPI0030E1518A